MQITLCKEPFEYIIIDETYTEEELKLIFLELDFWALSNNLMGPEHTGTAKWSDGSIKKHNKGVFLDEVYTDRKYSNILKLNRKIYDIELKEPSVIKDFLHLSNRDMTLVSYYENENYYKFHRDDAIITTLTYLYKQPKKFEGGDLILTDYGIAFEPWFNRTYVMPSVVKHEVTETKMKLEDCNAGFGRYCIANFVMKNH